MKTNSVAVFVVVYPRVEPYLNDFLSSLTNQTYSDFDLIIYNDGLTNLDGYLNKYQKSYEVHDTRLSPLKIREDGISYILERGYEKVIFCDSDDTFSVNRFEDSVSALDDHTITFNDVTLTKSDGTELISHYFANRLSNRQLIDYDFLADKNVLGLSNSAMRLEVVKTLDFPEGLIALDWYLFTLLLMEGHKACFLASSTTFYRQHNNNTVGLSHVGPQFLKKTVATKRLHYSALHRLFGMHATLAKKYEILGKASSAELERQMEKNPPQPDFPFWWEII